MGRLIRFDALGVTLLDRERGEFRVLDVAARTTLPEAFDVGIPIAGTLTAWVASQQAPPAHRRRHRRPRPSPP